MFESEGIGVLGAREREGSARRKGEKTPATQARVPDRVDTSTPHERRYLRFVADYREKN